MSTYICIYAEYYINKLRKINNTIFIKLNIRACRGVSCCQPVEGRDPLSQGQGRAGGDQVQADPRVEAARRGEGPQGEEGQVADEGES